MHLEHAFYCLAVFFLGRQVEGDRDPLTHEHLVLSVYLLDSVGIEAVFVEGNLTRRQRAGKGAEQSAAGRHHQVIEGSHMRLHLVGRDTAVFDDLVMATEHYGLLLRREVHPPYQTPNWLYLHPRDVGYIRYRVSFP